MRLKRVPVGPVGVVDSGAFVVVGAVVGRNVVVVVDGTVIVVLDIVVETTVVVVDASVDNVVGCSVVAAVVVVESAKCHEGSVNTMKTYDISYIFG